MMLYSSRRIIFEEVQAMVRFLSVCQKRLKQLHDEYVHATGTTITTTLSTGVSC